MWVLLAKPAKGKRTKWRPITYKGMCDRGSRVDDTWWMAFRTKADVERGRQLFQAQNNPAAGELRLRQMSCIPGGWK